MFAGGFFAAFVFLVIAHIETRLAFRRLIDEYVDNPDDRPDDFLGDFSGGFSDDHPDDDLDWKFTQTDSPSEP